MLIPHVDFPVRLPMEQGESLAGYVCRFQGTNGHWVPRILHDALHDLYRGYPEKVVAAFNLVQSVLGNIVALDRKWWLERPLVAVRGRQQGGWPTLSYKRVQFCPACLGEKGFHFALWELPLMEACPLHESALISVCTVCGKELNWSDISPHWCCRCGQPISGMCAGMAKPGTVNIARLVALTQQVELPADFRNDFLEIAPGAIHLGGIYEAIQWATKLRDLLQHTTWGFRSRPEKKKDCRRFPGAWEARLLSDSGKSLACRFGRLLTRSFRHHEAPLSYFRDYDVFDQAMKFVSIPTAGCGVFQERVSAAVTEYIEAHRVELPLSITVLFKPEIAGDEREERLARFAAWWTALANRMGDLDDKARTLPNNHSNTNHAHRDQLIIELLSAFLRASHNQVDVEILQKLIHWWHLPKAMKERMHPDQVLNRIVSYLVSISASEVLLVHELVNDDYEVIRTCHPRLF